MTPAERCANHRRLTRVGFRRHPDGSYLMPGYPAYKLNVTSALESIEDVIELVFAWGHREGQRAALDRARQALQPSPAEQSSQSNAGRGMTE